MSETIRARYLLFALTAFSYVIVFPLAAAVGLGIDFTSFLPLTAFALPFTVVLSLLCNWRNIPTLRAGVETMGSGLLLTMPVVVVAYLAMRTDLPLQDQTLMALDRRLGIDLLPIIQAVDAWPLLAVPLNYAYTSFAIQLLILPIILAVNGRLSRSYQMVTAYGVICYISSAISILYPAAGTFTTLNIDRYSLKNIGGHFPYSFVDQLVQVRDNPDFLLRLDKAAGIICFPSVHAAVAALCIWAAWEVKWLRYPFVALNVLMFISAITQGSHYVVDLIAGIGVAGFSIAMVLLVTRVDLRTRTLRDIAGKGAHSPSISLD